MLPAQQALYEEHIKKYDTQFTRQSSSTDSNDYDLVSLYMDLRKIANHPLLVRKCQVIDWYEGHHYSGQKLTRIATLLYEAHHCDKRATVETIEADLSLMSDIEIHFTLDECVESIPSLHRYLVLIVWIPHY